MEQKGQLFYLQHESQEENATNGNINNKLKFTKLSRPSTFLILSFIEFQKCVKGQESCGSCSIHS